MELLKLSGKFDKEDYIKLGKFASSWDHSSFINEIKDYFGWIFDKQDMDYIGLHLQICIKKSRPMYLHGYVISSALYQYIQNNNDIEKLTILETGTARGFADIVMAKVLQQTNKNGIINTIDILGHNNINKWNSIECPNLTKISRYNILNRWSDLRDNYINFITGYSNTILQKLNIGRIHFAFLDGAHKYNELTNELDFVERNQESGDIIICDDYTKKQFPEICKAIDKFLNNKKYIYKFFYGNDGVKKRGYVFMKKI